VLIRGISLDAAGTIIRIKEPVAQTYTEIANRHGIPIDAPTISKAFRTVFPRMSPLAFGSTEGAGLQRQERAWWSTLVRNCLGRFGQHRGFNAFFDELYQHYAEPEAWCVYDDVLPLLAKLEAHDIPVVVVSNFDSRLHNILRGFALHDAFREVLCSSMVGSAKPDTRIFTAACQVLRSQPSQVLHVGDDRRADYDGARNAGLSARWLDRDQPHASEHEQIASLDAVYGLQQCTRAYR
jgi:putative hydrolase of the HAD superfamily